MEGQIGKEICPDAIINLKNFFANIQDCPAGRAMDEESRREKILPGASASFRKGRRSRRVAAKARLKPARSREEPPPWCPKEPPSLPGPGAFLKTGGGQDTQDT